MLNERRILVTGGSRGIGAEIVRISSRMGAKCAFIARDPEVGLLISRETGAIHVQADLSDPEESGAAVQRAAEALRGLDALINNAGAFYLGNVTNGRYQDWRSMVDLNVLGLLAATQTAIPYLTASDRGQIVNISSLSGRRVGSAATGVYAGTKHAVHAITEGLNRELHGAGIRATVIAPGVVETNYGEYISDPDARAVSKTQQEDWGLDPCDVANQVIHVLASPPDLHITEIALMSARQPPG